MLFVKKEEKRFKFNQDEYRINRRTMLLRVSKIISMRIAYFMKRILTDELEYNPGSAEHEEIREVSLLFKELHYGKKTWDVQVPKTGFASIMPIFYSFNVDVFDQTIENLEKEPSPHEVEKFI